MYQPNETAYSLELVKRHESNQIRGGFDGEDAVCLLAENVEVPQQTLRQWQHLVRKIHHLSRTLENAVCNPNQGHIGPRQLEHMVSTMDILLEYVWNVPHKDAIDAGNDMLPDDAYDWRIIEDDWGQGAICDHSRHCTRKAGHTFAVIDGNGSRFVKRACKDHRVDVMEGLKDMRKAWHLK